MSEDVEIIDFDDFREKRNEIEERKSQFKDFFSFILGLILGAVIATPLQLALQPISYQSGGLKYGPVLLLESAPWWIIPLFSIIFLVILLYVLLLSYTFWLGLVGRESVSLPYNAPSDYEIVSDFVNYTIEEGNALGLDVTYKKTHKRGIFQRRIQNILNNETIWPESTTAKSGKIICTDPNRELAHKFVMTPGPILTNLVEWIYPKKVLEIRFDSGDSQVHMLFDPNNSRSVDLLSKIEDKYS